MCYHTTQQSPAPKLKKAFGLPMEDEVDYEVHYHANGFAHPKLAVISSGDSLALRLYKWGLVPTWVKTPEDALKLSNQTLNAKSETIFEKPSFRDSIVKRRCVIPVEGFFEWKHVGKDKIPYFIHPKEHDYFLLAGIYANWKNPVSQELFTSFSIITTEANELMADIHNTKKRMPLIIDHKNLESWVRNDLPKSGIIELMQPCDDRNMAAYTISKKIGDPKINTNTPDITNQIQETLF